MAKNAIKKSNRRLNDIFAHPPNHPSFFSHYSKRGIQSSKRKKLIIDVNQE
jgi:hypothetical protein